MSRYGRSLRYLIGACVVLAPLLLAQVQLGRIIGEIRVSRGDFPPHPILVELQLRGSTVSSVYTDDQGRFGFYSLEANPYHVLVRDEAFNPVDEVSIVNPLTSATNMVQIHLERRQSTQHEPLENRNQDSNQYLVDLSEYSRRFPKKAIREFDKGVQADRQGKSDVAIRHYVAALRIAPDFYPARNNLGSDYMNRSDLAAARSEFEKVIQLNQSDANAYFNLCNLNLVSGQITNAEQFLAEGLRRDPNSALGYFLLGSLNLKTGKYGAAEIALRHASQLNPMMAQPRLQLVNLFIQQGKRTEAAAALREFLSTFPNSPFEIKAKEMLHQLDVASNSQSPEAP